MQLHLAVLVARHDDRVIELEDLRLDRLAEAATHPLGGGPVGVGNGDQIAHG
jgi:hypothetical protein